MIVENGGYNIEHVLFLLNEKSVYFMVYIGYKHIIRPLFGILELKKKKKIPIIFLRHFLNVMTFWRIVFALTLLEMYMLIWDTLYFLKEVIV